VPTEHVPIEDLIDVSAVGPGTRPPSPRELREALPRGWALDDNNRTAHRDVRLLFREGWILVIGMALFGAGALFFFQSVLPRGFAGFLRFGAVVVAVLLVGGLVGPLISKALLRRS